MNDINFEFEFGYWNFNLANFKKKQMMILLGVIGGSRLGKYFKFSGYGNISFSDEDTAHRYPIIEMQEKYNRNKTNVLVFDMPVTDRNIDGLYDKMFLYQTDFPHIPNYGYVLYNTKTKKTNHIFYIDYDINDLTISLNKSLSVNPYLPIYKFYGDKYDYFKRNRKDLPLPSETLLNTIKKESKEKVMGAFTI